MDNIVNKATEHGPYTYNYDSLYRLAGAVSPVLPQESFSYDPVGNRLTSSAANNWTYNSNNELQTYNGVTFQYDLNGNTTLKNDNGTIQNFLYNEDDRLTEVRDGSGAVIASYYYDPFGRRLWKVVGGARIYFMYADEGLGAEFDGTGSQTKSYGYAPNSTWTTNPLFMKQGGEYFFYHNDHLGTPQKMTAANGSVVWSVKYESFGKAEIDASSTIENNLRFPGQYWDSETGLNYNLSRYYDSLTGRYMTQDPLGFGGGINPFAYAENNPLARYDSLGLISMYEDCLSRCRKDALLNAAFNAIPGGIFFKAMLAPAGLFDFNFLQAKAGYDEFVQTSPMDATAGISNMVYTYAYGKATLFDNPGLKGWEREQNFAAEHRRYEHLATKHKAPLAKNIAKFKQVKALGALRSLVRFPVGPLFLCNFAIAGMDFVMDWIECPDKCGMAVRNMCDRPFPSISGLEGE